MFKTYPLNLVLTLIFLLTQERENIQKVQKLQDWALEILYRPSEIQLYTILFFRYLELIWSLSIWVVCLGLYIF